VNNKQESLYQALEKSCLEYHVDICDDHHLQATAVFMFNENYPGFSGHFPGQPVLPAIVQLAMVRYLAECALCGSLLPVRYERTKFRAMIQPGEKVEVDIDFTKKKENWSGSFVIQRTDKEQVATGSAEFFLQ